MVTRLQQVQLVVSGFLIAPDLEQGIKRAPSYRTGEQRYEAQDDQKDAQASPNHARETQVKQRKPQDDPNDPIQTRFIDVRHGFPSPFVIIDSSFFDLPLFRWKITEKVTNEEVLERWACSARPSPAIHLSHLAPIYSKLNLTQTGKGGSSPWLAWVRNQIE
jgi:hypothetical protein